MVSKLKDGASIVIYPEGWSNFSDQYLLPLRQGAFRLAILSGFTFVENLFAQHLAHKTVFSILALVVFGTLLGGRYFAGWRGARAVRLYLGGFLLLCVAYFGTRLILEQVLNRSWG